MASYFGCNQCIYTRKESEMDIAKGYNGFVMYCIAAIKCVLASWEGW